MNNAGWSIRPLLFAIGIAAILGYSLTAPATVVAATDPGAACAASKQKAAAKKLSSKVKCHGIALKKNIPVDAACLTKAETKFDESFSKAEDKGGCATTGDTVAVENLVDGMLADLLAALPATAPVVENCSNGMDDDGDGFIDCLDFDCDADPLCGATENCMDVMDNDGDGFVDCLDSDCDGDPLCGATENCSNGEDDDGDGDIDCVDSDCAGDPVCPTTENCSNVLDDDGDGFVDCLDSDCDADPLCAP